MKAVVNWIEAIFATIPLPLLEVWGRLAYVVGFVLAICAFTGFTFRPGGRWGLGRERQAWDAKALLCIPLTFVLIVVSGYVGSFVVLVPGAQTFESLKDLVVFLCIVLFGHPALIVVPFAYGLSDLLEGVPPEFLADWLPGYFINPACFWVAYQLFGKNPDFRQARTWGRYLVFVLIFLAMEPVLWGYICSGKFTSEISYRSITPALFFTTGLTWVLAPLAMLGALPLARRFGLFWAEIPGHVKERRLKGDWIWEAGKDGARPDAGAPEQGLPIRMFILAPFIAFVLVMVGVTAYVTLRSAEDDATKLATRLHQEIAENIHLKLDDTLARPGAALDGAAVARLLAELPISTHGRAFILDRSGGIIASSSEAGDPVVRGAIDHLRRTPGRLEKLESSLQFQYDHVSAKPLSRETWLGQAAVFQGQGGGRAGWIVVTAMPEAYYLAGVRTGNSRSAMVFALALLLALALAAFQASMVTAPLRRIARATQALTRTNLTERVPRSGLEELDALGQSFNEMAAQLQNSFEDLLSEMRTRSRAEAALRESEHRYRTTLEKSLEGCQLLGPDWRYLYLNDAAAVHNRRPNSELLGRTMQEMWPGIEQASIYAAIERCMKDGVPAREDVEFTFPDGSKGWFDMGVQPAGEGVLVLSIDRTQRVQAEQALRELNQRLESEVAARTAQLQAALVRAESADRIKSAFLATMSHELRTPLNSIIGFTGILLQGMAGPTNEEQTKQLGMVRNSARHLLALINDVLDISKIEAGEMKVAMSPFDLRGTIVGSVAAVRPFAESKRLDLRLEISPAVGKLTSDARRVEQILLNLLNNAIKFTERGEVVLSADVVETTVQVRISDTGIGIKAEDLANLFRPFQQVETGLPRSHEGTGLGLVICRRLADLLGGEIRVESEPGRGSTFTVILPEKGAMPV